MSSADLVIRPYRPGDERGVLELFNAVFAEDDPGYEARAEAAWRWEFVDNPAGTQVVLGVEPGGRIVAQYACVPAVAHLRGRQVCCGQGVDSVVHADYRRGLRKDGAWLRTARYYFERYGVPEVNAFGYGFPNDKAYRVGVKLLGYTPVHAPVPALYRNLHRQTDDEEVRRGAAAGEVVTFERFDARADRLWARLEPGLPMAIRRTAGYLNWRYADCPRGRYRGHALLAPDGELRAMAVTRPDWGGPPILAVAEWLVEPEDSAAAARLAGHVVDEARAAGQARVECWLPPWHAQHATLRELGFGVEDSPCNLCIVIYEPDLQLDWVTEHWYFTIGDSDVY